MDEQINNLNEQKSFYKRKGMLALMLIVALAVLWLGARWLRGVSPSSSDSEDIVASEKTEQQLSEKNVLDSLTVTVPTTSSSTTVVPSTPVLKSLTPASVKTNAKTVETVDNTAVLDSLTPKK